MHAFRKETAELSEGFEGSDYVALHDGEWWYTWTCVYQFEGRPFTVDVLARTEAEALRRIRAIGMTGVADGRLISRISFDPGLPVVMQTGLMRAHVFLLNLLRRAKSKWFSNAR